MKTVGPAQSYAIGFAELDFILKQFGRAFDEWQDRYQSEVRVSVAISQTSDAKLMNIVASAKAPMIEGKVVEAIEAATDITDTSGAIDVEDEHKPSASR